MKLTQTNIFIVVLLTVLVSKSEGHTNCIPEGLWGRYCDKLCPTGCYGDTACTRLEGLCTTGCDIGFFGDKCTEACPAGCLEKYCHRGGDCAEGCVDGKWGDFCKKACNAKCLGGVCGMD